MTLEVLERESFEYLNQVENPLVPIRRLLRHLRDGDDCGDITEGELVAFLGEHDLFRVIDVGDGGEPRVILNSRIPSRAEMADQFQQQMDDMTGALGKALRIADEEGDIGACSRIQEILDRAETLRQKLRDALE